MSINMPEEMIAPDHKATPGHMTSYCPQTAGDSLSETTRESGALLPCLPPPPDKPLDSDCCGGGCVPCVMDIYREEVALWEADCQRLQAGVLHGHGIIEQQEAQLHPIRYAKFTIQDIQPEAEDSIRIRCELASQQTLGLSLGQHIIVKCQQSGSVITRQYTPVSPLDARGYFELIIKVYPEGRMSQRVATWKVGHQLDARGPFGHLSYVRNKLPRMLLLCAGTGIAPMCPVIHAILGDPEEETCLRLVYACRSYQHLMAKPEIQEWQRFWNFSCLYVLSQESVSPDYRYKIGESVHRGRINQDIVRQEIGDSYIHTTLVLVCGTQSFNKDMMAHLGDLGVPASNIHQY